MKSEEQLRNLRLKRPRSEAKSWAQSEQSEERPALGDRKSISSEFHEVVEDVLLKLGDRNEVTMIDDRRLCRLCMLAVIVSLFGEKAIMLM